MAYQAPLDDIIKDWRNSVLQKQMGVASFTLLIWDHIITFNDEVKYIWKADKGSAAYLFLLNRYLVPLSFCVNLWAYFREGWPPQGCKHFVRFEGSMTMIGITIVALMMFLRVKAMYSEKYCVQGFVLSILFIFIGTNTYLLTHGTPVQHAAYPLVDSCTMVFDSSIGPVLASTSAWMPLVYDTVVVSLTLARTLRSVMDRTAGEIWGVLLREGLLYYSVICSVTLVLTLMIIIADQSVKLITAQLELCLTVTMMSRITLHLKRFASSTSGTDQRSRALRNVRSARSWSAFDTASAAWDRVSIGLRFARPRRPPRAKARHDVLEMTCELSTIDDGEVAAASATWASVVFDGSADASAGDRRAPRGDEEQGGWAPRGAT
ncbi:hypothetical protein BC834DRAFT_877556 [Gloeopeniophorella convolvens]|nr:hypothetical protein BC834DRAFT_877556 [Gloeopeniophorella convolvens]